MFADNNGDVNNMVEQMLDLILANLGLETGEIFLNSDEKPDEYNLIVHKGHESSNSLLGLNTIANGEGLLGTCTAKNETYLMKPAQLDAINERGLVRTKLNYIFVLPNRPTAMYWV